MINHIQYDNKPSYGFLTMFLAALLSGCVSIYEGSDEQKAEQQKELKLEYEQNSKDLNDLFDKKKQEAKLLLSSERLSDDACIVFGRATVIINGDTTIDNNPVFNQNILTASTESNTIVTQNLIPNSEECFAFNSSGYFCIKLKKGRNILNATYFPSLKGSVLLSNQMGVSDLIDGNKLYYIGDITMVWNNPKVTLNQNYNLSNIFLGELGTIGKSRPSFRLKENDGETISTIEVSLKLETLDYFQSHFEIKKPIVYALVDVKNIESTTEYFIKDKK